MQVFRDNIISVERPLSYETIKRVLPHSYAAGQLGSITQQQKSDEVSVEISPNYYTSGIRFRPLTDYRAQHSFTQVFRSFGANRNTIALRLLAQKSRHRIRVSSKLPGVSDAIGSAGDSRTNLISKSRLIPLCHRFRTGRNVPVVGRTKLFS
jgi:hypothetical protein